MRGNFITLEGPEGAGKSSICKMLIEAFSRDILLVREPGSTQLGEKIRKLLQEEDMPDRAELLLFEAARACIVDQVISPSLILGKDILCDRFFDSTTVYQGFGRGLNIKEISMLNSMATNGLSPDLTIILDIDPKLGSDRKGKASDRIEAAGLDFHTRIRDGYLEIAKHQSRFQVVDASFPLPVVFEQVCSIIKQKFNWQLKSEV